MPMHGLVPAKHIHASVPMHQIEPAMAQINSPMRGLYHHTQNLVPLHHCQAIMGANAQLCTKNPLNTINITSEAKYNANRTAIASNTLPLNEAFPLASRVIVNNAPIWHMVTNQTHLIKASIPARKIVTPVVASFENAHTGKVVKVPLAIVGKEYRIVAGLGKLQNSNCSITSFGNNQFIIKAGCHSKTALSSNSGDIAVTLKAVYLSPYPTQAALKLGAGSYHLVSPVHWQANLAPDTVNIDGKVITLNQSPININLTAFNITVEKTESLTLVGNANHQFTVNLAHNNNDKNFNSNQSLQLQFKSNVFDHDKVKYTISCDNTLEYNGQKHCALVNLAEKTPTYNKGAADRSENPLQLYLHQSNQSGLTDLTGHELLPDTPIYQSISTEQGGYQYDYEVLQIKSPGLGSAEPGQWQGMLTINATVAF